MKRIVPWSLSLGAGVIIAMLSFALSGCGSGNNDSGTSTAVTPPAATKEAGIVVAMRTEQDPEPLKAELLKAGDANHVRWSNETDVPRVIHFKAGWPFMEAEEDIQVPAQSKSSWYTASNVTSTSYPYEITPPLKSSGGPPDEPAITFGD